MTDVRPTHLDIFSGIGGFAIAAQWAGFRTVAFCESDARGRTFLEKTWQLPVHNDVRTFDAKPYRGVSLLTGGPPCQPASRAGKQGGEGDDRWLWPEALRVLEEAKPDCVVFENPPGILDVGIDGILSEMGRLGYEVQPFDIPACAVDSPQLRYRIWFVGFLADAKCGRRREQLRTDPARESFPATERREGASRSRSSSENSDVADTCGEGHEERGMQRGISGREECTNQRQAAGVGVKGKLANAERERRERWPESKAEGRDRPGLTGSPWQNSVWVPCADGKLRRAPDDSFGLVNGLHRSLLAALGNSICPEVAFQILRAVRTTMSAFCPATVESSPANGVSCPEFPAPARTTEDEQKPSLEIVAR